MKKAIIIHGYYTKEEYCDLDRPSPSNDHWIPWLQRQLLLKGIETQTPEMPGFYEPNYEKWKETLDMFKPDKETILVGHSCGGGFLVRYLSEQNIKVNNVILVAPWLDPDKNIDPEFFNFSIDNDLCKKANEVSLLYSKDDFPEVIKSVDTIKEKISNLNIKEFENMGHFSSDSMKSEGFPELLEECLN